MALGLLNLAGRYKGQLQDVMIFIIRHIYLVLIPFLEQLLKPLEFPEERYKAVLGCANKVTFRKHLGKLRMWG